MVGETTAWRTVSPRPGHARHTNLSLLFLIALSGALTLHLHDSVLEATAPVHDDFVSNPPALVEANTNTTPNAHSPIANSKNSSNASDVGAQPSAAKAIANTNTNTNTNTNNIDKNEPAPAAKTKTKIDWNDTTTTNRDKEGFKDDIERALFVICMGEKATKSTVVERLVYSARTAGMFSGWIVVLTDAPPERYATLSNWTDNLVFMKPREEDIKKHYKLANMTYKRFKTLVLDYLDRESKLDKVELVYYLDADIVIGNAIGKAFRGLEKIYGIGRLGATANTTTPSIARGKIWMFEGNSDNWPFQGGQMILDRSLSRPCLERFRRGFDAPDSDKQEKDQNILFEMKQEMETAMEGRNTTTVLDCEIVKMVQAPYVEFPSVKEFRKREAYLKKHPEYSHSKSYSPIVHLRNDAGFARARRLPLVVMDLLRFQKGEPDPLGVLKKISLDTKKENKQE